MEPISREFLLKQNKCCNNGCANCPYKINKTNKIMNAKEYLHSDEISEWDTVFDPGGKQEYTEEQLIRFAEIWGGIKAEDERLVERKRIEDILQSIESAQGSACKVASAKVELLSLYRDLEE
jgi:hypothetical protein